MRKPRTRDPSARRRSLSQAALHLFARHGYDANIVWGSDYPHVEGTFLHQDDPSAEPITQLSLMWPNS